MITKDLAEPREINPTFHVVGWGVDCALAYFTGGLCTRDASNPLATWKDIVRASIGWRQIGICPGLLEREVPADTVCSELVSAQLPIH